MYSLLRPSIPFKHSRDVLINYDVVVFFRAAECIDIILDDREKCKSRVIKIALRLAQPAGFKKQDLNRRSSATDQFVKHFSRLGAGTCDWNPNENYISSILAIAFSWLAATDVASFACVSVAHLISSFHCLNGETPHGANKWTSEHFHSLSK